MRSPPTPTNPLCQARKKWSTSSLFQPPHWSGRRFWVRPRGTFGAICRPGGPSLRPPARWYPPFGPVFGIKWPQSSARARRRHSAAETHAFGQTKLSLASSGAAQLAGFFAGQNSPFCRANGRNERILGFKKHGFSVRISDGQTDRQRTSSPGGPPPSHAGKT